MRQRPKKIIFRISVIIISLILIWKIYDYTTWNKSPNLNELPVNVGTNNEQYQQQILFAQQYLKLIPKKLNVPSFSVAVGINNEIVWSEAIGYQNIENRIKADTNTIYRIGSSSKAVTATISAILVEEGLLKLDTLIGNDIKNYSKKKWLFTPRQLLSHSAGLPDYGDLNIRGLYSVLCNCKKYKNVTQALNIFNDVELLYKPNSDYKYTTMDYILLSAYLEEISGSNFLNLLSEKLTTPLNMNNTFGCSTLLKNKTLATFYEINSKKHREWRSLGIFTNDIDLSYKWAGGGILSTPTDLVKMGNAILNDTTFLTKQTKKIFFTPQKLDNGKINPQRYALGWRSYKTYKDDFFENEVWMVHHGGVSKGSMNFLVLFPDYNIVINASMNARAEDFQFFWKEVMKLSSFFLNPKIETKINNINSNVNDFEKK